MNVERLKLRTVAGSMLLAAVSGLTGCGAAYPPLATVGDVDLARYTGKWYEIARYPNFFERNCVGVTAEYSEREDGRIEVVNTCRPFSLDAQPEQITGVARVADPTTNAKLKVSFFGPFEGDYWILDLDNDYQYAVVGAPNRNYFWILSREPSLDEEIYDRIIERMPDWGFNPEQLYVTPQ
jgi:apolipoprotein D and lipocalin family protein